MNNLLPTYQGRADAPSDAFNKLSAWEPEKSDARNPKNVPYGLGVDLSEEIFEQKYLKNAPAQPDHNHRNLTALHHIEPSPLSFSQRGEAEIAHIAMPKLAEESTTTLMNKVCRMSTVHLCVVRVYTCSISSVLCANPLFSLLQAKHVPKELPLLISVSNLHDNVCMDLFMQRGGGTCRRSVRHGMCRRSVRHGMSHLVL